MIKIPKLLHCIWVGPYNIPEKNFLYSWKDTQKEFDIILWNNSHPKIKNYIDEAVDLFNGVENLKDLAMTYICDVLRLLILRDYGGIYIDHDVLLLKNLSPLIENKKMILTFQYDPEDYESNIILNKGFKLKDYLKIDYKSIRYEISTTVNNCFIGSVSNHQIIKDALEIIKGNHLLSDEEKIPISDWTVGPYSLTLAAKNYGLDVEKSLTTEKDNVIIYHRDYLHPIRGGDRLLNGENWYNKKIDDITRNQSSYAIHYQGHFGINMYLNKNIITFEEWYKNFK